MRRLQGLHKQVVGFKASAIVGSSPNAEREAFVMSASVDSGNSNILSSRLEFALSGSEVAVGPAGKPQ